MSALLTTLTVVCLAHADVIVNCNAGLANRLRATAEAYVNLHKAPANTTVVWGAPTYATATHVNAGERETVSSSTKFGRKLKRFLSRECAFTPAH